MSFLFAFRRTGQWLGYLVFFVLLSLPNASSADASAERVVIKTSKDIISIYGFLFFPKTPIDDARDVRLDPKDIQLTKSASGTHWIAEVQLSTAQRSAANSLVLLAKVSDGTTILSPVRSFTKTTDGRVGKSRCSDELGDPSVLSAMRNSSLKDLVRLRVERVALLDSYLKSLLNAEALLKLNERERKLGLSYATPISSETSAEELSARITAVESLAVSRAKKKKIKRR